jgi:hypothetical protein
MTTKTFTRPTTLTITVELGEPYFGEEYGRNGRLYRSKNTQTCRLSCEVSVNGVYTSAGKLDTERGIRFSRTRDSAKAPFGEWEVASEGYDIAAFAKFARRHGALDYARYVLEKEGLLEKVRAKQQENRE